MSEDHLKFKRDSYDCITLDEKSLPTEEAKFGHLLSASIKKWRSDRVKGIWLTISQTNAHLIPVAIELGFSFHHTYKDELVLSLWLLDIPSKLPEYASVSIGVGGYVYDEDLDKLLVVKELSGPIKGVWKLPGGLVDRSEDIYAAAAREVLEETNVTASVKSFVLFRSQHNCQFDVTNLYFVALMKPETKDIKIQPDEIQDAKWMSIEELHDEGCSSMLSEVIPFVKSVIDGTTRGITYEEVTMYRRRMTLYSNKL